MTGQAFAQICVRALALYALVTGIMGLLGTGIPTIYFAATRDRWGGFESVLFTLWQPWSSLCAVIIGVVLWKWSPWLGSRLTAPDPVPVAATDAVDQDLVTRVMLALVGLVVVVFGIEHLIRVSVQELALAYQMQSGPPLLSEKVWGLARPEFVGNLIASIAQILIGALICMRARTLLAFIRTYGRPELVTAGGEPNPPTDTP